MSDSCAPVLPEVLAAIEDANVGHAPSYGADDWTARLQDAVRAVFGDAATVFPVFNGTGANVVALRAMLRPWEGVVCADTAHINTSEGGAPEAVGAIKTLVVPGIAGKLTPERVELRLIRLGDEHAVQPKAVSVAQSTELGTVYTVDELAALTAFAHERGLLVYVDGARLAAAAASLGVTLAAVTSEVGVDVVSFGGTKLGMLGGEAIIVLRPGLSQALRYLRKQSMQLPSKMRYVSAQLLALLTDELWLKAATSANAMARRLADGVHDVVEISRPVEANAVFAVLPPGAAEKLRRDFDFVVWNPRNLEVRWMCSWDTTARDVDDFVRAIRWAVAADASASHDL